MFLQTQNTNSNSELKNAFFYIYISMYLQLFLLTFLCHQDISSLDELNLQKTLRQSTEQLKILNKILNYS